MAEKAIWSNSNVYHIRGVCTVECDLIPQFSGIDDMYVFLFHSRT